MPLPLWVKRVGSDARAGPWMLRIRHPTSRAGRAVACSCTCRNPTPRCARAGGGGMGGARGQQLHISCPISLSSRHDACHRLVPRGACGPDTYYTIVAHSHRTTLYAHARRTLRIECPSRSTHRRQASVRHTTSRYRYIICATLHTPQDGAKSSALRTWTNGNGMLLPAACKLVPFRQISVLSHRSLPASCPHL